MLQIVDGLDDLISSGFAEQLNIIKTQLQPDIQVGVLSATFSEEVVNVTNNGFKTQLIELCPIVFHQLPVHASHKLSLW